MGPTRTYHDLLEAFGQDGCAVCRLAARSVSSFLSSISNEGGLTDPEVRDRIRAAHGFCNEHAHQWLREQHLLGTAILYEDLLDHLATELQALRFQKRGRLGNPFTARERTPVALAAHQECAACRSLADTEQRMIAAVLSGLRAEEFRTAYEHSRGLCVPHLRVALAEAPDEDLFATLTDLAVARHKALAEQLREIIRRHDYRYSEEPSGEERGAAARAVRQVVGEQGIRGMDHG
ncbi:MAG: DUF6062 family protein [Chloroflexota bacterium]|nr:DUF6062 family protein [Chloroflexota bacterium]